MSTVDAYVVDEPVAWTNISSFTLSWMENYVRPRPHTEVTVDSSVLATGLFCFAQTFDYDRSHYALFIIHSNEFPNIPPLAPWGDLSSLGDTGIEWQEPIPQEPVSLPAARYATDLLRWLTCTYDDLALMTGISRSAFFYWRRTGATPRPSNLRPLLRLHSLVGALVRRFEQHGAQAWLNSGDPTPRDLLIRGDILAVEDMFRRLLMVQPNRHGRYARRVEEADVDLELPQTTNSTMKRAERRPKQGTL